MLTFQEVEFFLKFEVPESLAAEYEKDMERHIFQVNTALKTLLLASPGEHPQWGCRRKIPGGHDHPPVPAGQELPDTLRGAQWGKDCLPEPGALCGLLPHHGH